MITTSVHGQNRVWAVDETARKRSRIVNSRTRLLISGIGRGQFGRERNVPEKLQWSKMTD